MAQGFGAWGNDLYTGRRSYQIVAHRRLWYLLGLATALIAVVLMLVKPGLTQGIEFSGGTQLTLSDVATPSQDLAVSTVREVVPDASPKVVNVGDHGLRIQMAELDAANVPELVTRLADAFDVSEDQISHTFIGPTWGEDVSKKTLTGIGWFLLFVAVVMTVYFRNWRMAVAALVALFHNLIVTGGVYAAVGWEVTPATIVGFLTIMGYSVYDTVVVFDKVRENTADTLDQSRYTYAEKANLAVNQTLVRSINTSVVALLPVGAILAVGAFILHAGTLRDIALALFVGIAVGTLSSIFLATPITVTLRELQPDIKAHNRKVLTARGIAMPPELVLSTTDPGPTQPWYGIGFGAAFARFWKKYATFGGRASRGEFWWAYLANALIGVVLGGGALVLAFVVLDESPLRRTVLLPLVALYPLATAVPRLAIMTRRLRDTGRSGWYVVIALVPIVGPILLLVFLAGETRLEGVEYDSLGGSSESVSVLTVGQLHPGSHQGQTAQPRRKRR